MFPFDDIIMIEFSFHWLNTTRMQTNTAMSQIDKVLCLSIFHRRGLFSWLHIFVLTKLWTIKKCYWVIPWCRHQMETFSALLDLGAGNSPVTDEFPPQRPLTWSFDFFSLICIWANGWTKNRDAGNLRRHRAHYDPNAMNSRCCDILICRNTRDGTRPWNARWVHINNKNIGQ